MTWLVLALLLIRFGAVWLHASKSLMQKLCDTAWFGTIILLLYLCGLWSTP